MISALFGSAAPEVFGTSTSALYGTAVALHVVCVVAGTVGLAVTTGYLAVCRSDADGPGVRRFFAAGPGAAPRLLYPAAAFGLVAALGSSQRVRLEWAWVWGAGVLWLGAAVCIEAWLRPAERRLAALLGAGGARARGSSARAAAGAGLAAAGTALALVLTASALMVAQP